MNTAYQTTSIAGIDVKYRVIGIEDFDIDEPENAEHFDKVQSQIEEGLQKGGFNFMLDDDLYTLEWKSKGMDIIEEEE